MEPPSYTGPLTVVANAYGDLQVCGTLPTDVSAFTAALSPIVSGASRGVWLRVPWDAAHAPLLPAALSLGFTSVHHASGGWLTLQAWRSPLANPTPDYACTDVGAGAFVVDGRGRLLAIRERFDDSGLWHTPGGHVDAGEDALTGAVREAREETGVAAVALGAVGWRELLLPMPPPRGSAPLSSAADLERQVQNVRFGSTNLAVSVLCAAPRNATIAADPAEIAEATWLEPLDFVARAHETEAVYARCMIATGMIDAAAARARALDALEAAGEDASAAEAAAAVEPAGTAAAPIAAAPAAALIASAPEIPFLSHGYVVQTSHRRWGDAGAYPAYWFHAFPDQVFAEAVRKSKSTLSVVRNGEGGGSGAEEKL